MAQQDVLKKYYTKLIRESLFKSILLGVIIGFAVGALVMMLFWIGNVQEWFAFNGTWVAIVVAILVAAGVSALFYFDAFRPTMKKAAERVDSLGFEERAITMLQMAGSDNPMAQIQREDVVVKLETPAPDSSSASSSAPAAISKFKIRVPKVVIILASIVSVFALAMFIVPNATGVFAEAEPPYEWIFGSEEEDEIIGGMLDELRDEIKNSNVPDKVKDELNQIVDNLEESLKGMDSLQDKIDAIEDAAEQIRDKLRPSNEQLGEALKGEENEGAQNLGEALEKGGVDEINSALDDIKDKINDALASGSDEMKQELSDLANSIQDALDKVDMPGDPLWEALDKLKDQLNQAAQSAQKGDTSDASDKTDQAIEDAKDAIEDALGNSDKNDLNKDMQGTIGDALDALDPNGDLHDPSDADSSDGEGDQKSEEETPPSDKDGQNKTDDPENSGAPSPDDDPYGTSWWDGNKFYMEEFEKYFREEMEKLANTDATQEEKEMIAKYFATLRMETDEGEEDAD